MSGKAKALPDDTAVSTRAAYQPGSATRKRIRFGCIPTEGYINRDRRSEAYLAQLYVNNDQQTKPPAVQPRPQILCSKASLAVCQL